MDITNLVRDTIRKYDLLTPGDKVVVGVSGGPDSVALINILNLLREEWDISLIVAHFNHGLRGDESDRDATFVKSLAETLALPYKLEKGDVSSYKKQTKLSMEEASRILRYRFLEATLEEEGAQKIALGHTADDQAEEILMRIFRGSGRLGLCGIPPVRNNVFIRPLIEVSRVEIERFLEERGLSYVIDSSNRDRRYLRNKIRLDLIPFLEKTYAPGLRQNLVQLSSILREEEDYLQAVIAQEFSKISKYHGPEKVIIDGAQFLDVHKALRPRMIRKAIETVNGKLRSIGFRHILAVLKLSSQQHPSKMLNLPGGLIVRRAYKDIIIEKEMKEQIQFSYPVLDLAPVSIKEVNKMISFKMMEYNEGTHIETDKNVAYLDYHRLSFPLTVRNIRPGDRFRPLGMKGFRKVKDFFIDCKVSRNVRKSIPILVEGDQIAWIVGLRIDDRVKITEVTKKVLRVEAKALETT